MRSAKSLLSCGLYSSTSISSFSTSSEMRPTVAVSAEVAKKLFDRLEEESSVRPTTTADLEQNKHLNRWHNILPFDATRVKLLRPPQHSQSTNGSASMSELSFNDYINASKIDAPFHRDKSYILTQGPLPETTGHFWTMVWQQSVSAIIMLCRLTETGTCKCAQYWPETPEDDDLIYVPNAGLEVRLRDFDKFDDFMVRHLELRHCETDSIRVITQYHYQTWPDFGVPHSTSAFLKFLYIVTSKHPSSAESPNVVHCSAGVGRSGTFILADSCLSLMKQTRKPMTRTQITDSLLRMRSMRWGLIQTWEQYRFCLQAIDDGMANIDFISNEPFEAEAEHNESNGAGFSFSNTRKRSTDSTGDDLSPNKASGSTTSGLNNDGVKGSSTAAGPPKRPKANC